MVAAITKGYSDIALFLIAKKANVDTLCSGRDALYYAVKKQCTKVIASLLENGVSLFNTAFEIVPSRKSTMMPILSFYLSSRPLLPPYHSRPVQSGDEVFLNMFSDVLPKLHQLRRAYHKATLTWVGNANACIKALHNVIGHLHPSYHKMLFQALKFEVYRILQWQLVIEKLSVTDSTNLVLQYVGSPILASNDPSALLSQAQQRMPVFNPAQLFTRKRTKRNNAILSSMQKSKRAKASFGVSCFKP